MQNELLNVRWRAPLLGDASGMNNCGEFLVHGSLRDGRATGVFGVVGCRHDTSTLLPTYRAPLLITIEDHAVRGL